MSPSPSPLKVDPGLGFTGIGAAFAGAGAACPGAAFVGAGAACPVAWLRPSAATLVNSAATRIGVRSVMLVYLDY
jgi:hypothetical protein